MRQRCFLILVVLLLLQAQAYAQRRVAGYVVTAAGDSIRGAIRLRNDIAQQLKVEFIPLNGAEAIMLGPEQLQAYGYVNGTDTVRYQRCWLFMLGQTGRAMSLAPHTIATNARTLGQKPVITRQDHPMGVLLRVLINGPVQLYRYHFYNGHGVGPSYYPSGSSSTSGSTILIRKLNEMPVDISWWNFPLRSAEFFKDDHSLAQQLRNRIYAARDIKQVVQQYNAWYLTQASAAPATP